MSTDKKIDWSEGRWKEMLIQQRKLIWREDTLNMFAKWLALTPGMMVVDVGCGLGYIGYTFWPFFGESGHYIGLDQSSKLLHDASEASREWASDGKASFVCADAYSLPIPDNTVDCAACQTLLMHLQNPEAALREMARVVKPGGLIICMEPDNLSTVLGKSYWTIPDLSIEEMLLSRKVHMLSNKGRIKLGRGDDNIAPKIPMMMKSLGLTDIDLRSNDRVGFLVPPYEGDEQQHRLAMMRKRVENEDASYWLDRAEEEFVAGGGDREEYLKMRDLSDRLKPVMKKQLEEGTYASCYAHFFFVVKGKKPM